MSASASARIWRAYNSGEPGDFVNINLNRRERIVVIGAGIFLAVFFIFQLVIAPVFERRHNLEAELAEKKQTAAQMHEKRDEYRQVRQRMEAAQEEFSGRPENFSLFAFLERLAGTSGIKNHIAYMRPSTTMDDFTGLTISRVEMRLEGITLENLADYLFQVEASENMVRVNRLSINKSGERDGPVNVVMRVETAEAS